MLTLPARAWHTHTGDTPHAQQSTRRTRRRTHREIIIRLQTHNPIFYCADTDASHRNAADGRVADARDRVVDDDMCVADDVPGGGFV
jgi:hypothetical protein